MAAGACLDLGVAHGLQRTPCKHDALGYLRLHFAAIAVRLSIMATIVDREKAQPAHWCLGTQRGQLTAAKSFSLVASVLASVSGNQTAAVSLHARCRFSRSSVAGHHLCRPQNGGFRLL